MPLSIIKLKDLLLQSGFIPHNFFVLDTMLFYIEVFIPETATTFLLYIPSKYEFVLDTNNKNSFVIEYIEMNMSKNFLNDYKNNDTYQQAKPITLSPDKDKLDKDLDNNYKADIFIKDISKKD